MDDFSLGFLIGILAGEGHFGGDGRQPQITLRMHIRHEKMFRWLERTIPAGKLYGPYHHGGRSYFQWMVRGSYLRESLAPLIATRIDILDDHVRSRFLEMCSRYAIDVSGSGAALGPPPSAADPSAAPEPSHRDDD